MSRQLKDPRVNPGTLPEVNIGPAHKYYQSCEGRWQSLMHARVTALGALISSMGLLNALSVLIMTYWPRALGRIWLETTVEYCRDQPVRHTTQVRWLGFAVMTSEEWVHIDPDGTHFEIKGSSRMAMFPWRSLEMSGQGHVNSSGTRATYHLNWLGTQMTQTTERHPEGCTLRQEAPGFSAVQDLRENRQAFGLPLQR